MPRTACAKHLTSRDRYSLTDRIGIRLDALGAVPASAPATWACRESDQVHAMPMEGGWADVT